jgi:hypothetical protein
MPEQSLSGFCAPTIAEFGPIIARTLDSNTAGSIEMLARTGGDVAANTESSDRPDASVSSQT